VRDGRSDRQRKHRRGKGKYLVGKAWVGQALHSQTRRTDAIDETVAWIWSDIPCSSCCLFLGTGQTVLDTIDAHELTSGIHSGIDANTCTRLKAAKRTKTEKRIEGD
jgi:hypothetical protein